MGVQGDCNYQRLSELRLTDAFGSWKSVSIRGKSRYEGLETRIVQASLGKWEVSLAADCLARSYGKVRIQGTGTLERAEGPPVLTGSFSFL